MNMTTIIEFSNEKLKKLNLINKILFGFISFWFLIIIIDGIFSGNFFEKGKFLSEVTYWMYPITLYLIIIITFYSSYKILENRNYKPFILFGLIQVIGFLIFSNFKIIFPIFFIKHNLLGTFLIAGLFVLIFYVLFLYIMKKDKSNEQFMNEVRDMNNEDALNKLQEITFEKSHSNLGDVISAIFSILIITLVNIRSVNIDFQNMVAFGSLIGFLFIAYIARQDQTVLAMLSLLDADEAKYLYLLKKIKLNADFDAKKRQDRTDIQHLRRIKLDTEIEQDKDVYQTSINNLVREIEKEKNSALYKVIKTELSDRLENFKKMSPREKILTLSKLEEDIALLRSSSGNLPEIGFSLLEVNSDMSIENKIATLTGLSNEEIEIAIEEKFINPNQKFLWSFSSQQKIKIAIKDFEDPTKYEGELNLYIAKSLINHFSTTNDVFKKMRDAVLSDNVKMSFIKGLENLDLMEFRINTITNEYSVVTRIGPDKALLIHTIIKV